MSLLEFVGLGIVVLWLFASAVVWLDKQWRRLTKRAVDGATTCVNCGMSQTTLFGKCDVCGSPRN